MLIVSPNLDQVEKDLAAGAIACPACGGKLGPWSFARSRHVRAEAASIVVRPRRARCRLCHRTHVLLPDQLLLRRVDVVAVIGRALAMAAERIGPARIAERLRRPVETVRAWLARARKVAERIRVHFSAWAHALDPLSSAIKPAGSRLGDAIEAIAQAARAGSLRLGPRPVWSFASAMTAGTLLCNTSSPWPGP